MLLVRLVLVLLGMISMMSIFLAFNLLGHFYNGYIHNNRLRFVLIYQPVKHILIVSTLSILKNSSSKGIVTIFPKLIIKLF